MTERRTYAATPYLRHLSRAEGWRGGLIRDQCGRVDVIVAVRVGPRWTDSVAIRGEDQTVAMRHRTVEDRPIVPGELPSEARAVWQRDGRCEDVLAELFELPDVDPIAPWMWMRPGEC